MPGRPSKVVEETILHAIGGIVQGLLDFRCWDLDHTPLLCQPQAAVGSLLNSQNGSKCFGICRDDPPEAFSIKESQSQFPTNPYMMPPTPDRCYAPNWRIIGGKTFWMFSSFQDDDCAAFVSEPCAAHPIRKGCPWGSILRILTRFQVAAILPFSDRTNLLFLQPARAHRSRLPLPQSRPLGKVSETRAVAQTWCSFPRYSDRWHQAKPPNRAGGITIRRMVGAGKRMTTIERVPREPGPWKPPALLPRRLRRLRQPKQHTGS